MQIPPHESRIWRFRFTVTDEPGSLAAAAAALAELGVNILNLDVHVISGTEAIDEATLSLPGWLDVPAVEHALRRTGATGVWAVPVPMHHLEDLATRVLRLAATVVIADADDDSLCDAIADLIDAELVVPMKVDSLISGGAAAWASGDGIVRFGREHIKRFPCRDGAWTMAVPDDHIAPSRVVVAARRSAPFTATEAARTQALLQSCAAGLVRSPELEGGPGRPDVCVGPLLPSHLRDVEDLHRRCSASSRYSRYFSPMPTIRHDAIARLLDGPGGRIAAGAWMGDRLVGMANACPHRADAGNCSELAVLVEDAHQGKGIGTRLVHELVTTATRRGTNDFVVVTLAGNRAMLRIVQRLSGNIGIVRDGGAVVLSFSLAAPTYAAQR